MAVASGHAVPGVSGSPGLRAWSEFTLGSTIPKARDRIGWQRAFGEKTPRIGPVFRVSSPWTPGSTDSTINC